MLLDVKNLSVAYGHVQAIDGISFSVESGEIVALLGSNGAGKSTAMKAVSGVLSDVGGGITSGELLFCGESIAGFRPDQLVSKGISMVPEGRRIFSSLSVRENLEMGGFLIRDRKKTQSRMEHVLETFTSLRNKLMQKAGALSGGDQQILALGRALMLEPVLLLVDEPSLGLSPGFIKTVFEKIQSINALGTSILLVEQNVSKALEVCHRAYVFEAGRIVLAGEKEMMLSESRVQNVFLGQYV